MSGRFFVHTFGCQMNVHDSDRMQDVLVAHGWTAAPSASSVSRASRKATASLVHPGVESRG